MTLVKPISNSAIAFIRSKTSDYTQLFKLRLSLMVVFSAIIGFLIGTSGGFYFLDLLMLGLGGFLITASSNTINQIFERDIDKLMSRTSNRPLPTGRMSVVEASIAAGITGVIGLIVLVIYFNPLAASIAAGSLLSYAFIYTPMKRISPIAVLIGAVPGALPPLIGYVCATGELSQFILIVFLIQFIWQFPHFWSIAWVAFDDYKKAGIMLLPYPEGRSKQNALMNIIYILIAIPIIFLPFILQFIGFVGTVVLFVSTVLFLIPAIRLFQKCDNKSAKLLMIASFLYLPIVLMTIVIDKL